MNFPAEKRYLLGVLALLAPLPLPFNEIVGWPEVASFWLAVILCLYRTSQGSLDVLPKWALNLLGLAYLPFLLLELRGVVGGDVLHPLAHLVLFTLAVKLFALKEEKDKWHAFLATFFLFLASMASSVHPTMLVYLVTFLALSIHTLTRFAGYDLLSRPGAATVHYVKVPIRRVTLTTTALVVFGAIPFFILMPRIRQPVVFSRVGLGTSETGGGSFQDTARLDSVGRVRSSREVVLRFHYDGGEPNPEPLLKALAYDHFDGLNWRRAGFEQDILPRDRDGSFYLADEAPRGAVELWLRTGGRRRLVLPVETVRVEARARSLRVDEGGVVALPYNPDGTFAYRALMGRTLGQLGAELPPPKSTDLGEPGAVSARITDLAASVMGEGSDFQRANRLMVHLRNDYTYTLDLGPVASDAPIERFLFDTKRGYCEYFATSMALMLRSQGIPARFVLGYLGAEKSLLEDYYIVRDAHAHAWVEAYFPEQGWIVMDPSPAVGTQAGLADGALALIQKAYDYLLFRWDRYVLTYSFTDQVGLFGRFRDAWRAFWERFRPKDAVGPQVQIRQAPAQPPATPEEPPEETEIPTWMRTAPFLIAPLVLAAWLLWRRRNFGPADAYQELRRALVKAGDPPIASTPPLEVRRRAEDHWPTAIPETHKVIDFYLRETYRGENLAPEDLADLRLTLRQAKRKFKKTA